MDVYKILTVMSISWVICSILSVFLCKKIDKRYPTDIDSYIIALILGPYSMVRLIKKYFNIKCSIKGHTSICIHRISRIHLKNMNGKRFSKLRRN